MEDGKVMNKLNILYEDNHLIVVEKEPNILSQSDITKDKDLFTIVKEYIKEKYNKPGNVYLGLLHRLDRPVGGIMVFAKTSKAAKRMTEQIKNHKFEKTYLAVVNGVMDKNEDIFIDYLKKTPNGNTIVTTKDDGKYSELKYKVLQKNKKDNMTLIEIDLKTGRHHQIRVQFSNRGYPLCGDQRYGNQDMTPIALFAYKIKFNHPITKENMEFKLEPKQNVYWTKFTT